MMRLRRDERLSNAEVAERVGLAANSVEAEFSRLRAVGFDVPGDPHRCTPRVGGAAYVTREHEVLLRSLARLGVYPDTSKGVSDGS
jgi:hypothetical protein